MKVLVCGTGSAGLLSALTIQRKAPDCQVEILRDRAFPVIGVGESTFGSFPGALRNDVGLDFDVFQRAVRPVCKYGLWLGFGPHDFHYSFQNTFDWKFYDHKYPQGFYIETPYGHNEFSAHMIECRDPFKVENNAGVHLENKRFLAHLEDVARARGIAIHEEPIESVERQGERVLSVNRRWKADVFVDCTGFQAKLTQEPWISFGDCLLNDRAIFYWREKQDPIRPYTKATTMPNGWLWEIDHVDGSGTGYVYSSKFASEEQALRELEATLGSVPGERVIRFDPGVRRRHWVGNVVSIGNADGFIEPLESTTLSIILRCAIDVGDVLSNGFDRTDMVHRYNANIHQLFWNIRDFILMHFVWNQRLDTPYWRACQSLEHKIVPDGIGAFILEYYRRNGPSLKFVEPLYTKYNFFGLEGYYTLFKGFRVPSDVDHVTREIMGH